MRIAAMIAMGFMLGSFRFEEGVVVNEITVGFFLVEAEAVPLRDFADDEADTGGVREVGAHVAEELGFV